jgi:competence protein ComEC
LTDLTEDLLKPIQPAKLAGNFLTDFGTATENWLSEERDQLPLWIPVGIGAGIISWEMLGDNALGAVLAITSILVFLANIRGEKTRRRNVANFTALTFVVGFVAIMIKSSFFAAPPITDIQISEFYARITKVEQLAARDKVRFELATGGHSNLPEKIRVNLNPDQFRPEFVPGAIIKLRARLMPPAGPTLPGAYDFSRRAWFSGIGASGSALGVVHLYRPSTTTEFFGGARAWIAQKIKRSLPTDSGAIALALATGEQGAILEADAEAMRRSGLAHLLSISGLHVTAVVGAIFLLFAKTLALFPRFALQQPVPIYAALAAAAGAIGYTLLTGAQVPTVRSCIAALMILAALALGRDALSLRLVAFGATVILLFWPEALAGPSFQLSFAAVSTIIVLHDSKWMRAFASQHSEGILGRIFGALFGLLITGLAIELVLAPITLFHFHKTGLYGAIANIVAIPLTTFVIMPFEALAILFDFFGLGAPFWWVAGQGISAILVIAHYVSNLPGAVATLPAMPSWAFFIIITGAFWFGIFKTSARWLGLIPCLIGSAGIITAPYPDILLTGDGKHLAIVEPGRNLVLLRPRAGDYVRNTLQENAGMVGEPIAIEDWAGANCSPDSCVLVLHRGDRDWTVLAIRTRYSIPAMELAAACRRADIVVSERWLPYSCQPRWIKADRNMWEITGGLAFYLEEGRVATVAQQSPNAPWFLAAQRAAIARDKRRQIVTPLATPNTAPKPPA